MNRRQDIGWWYWLTTVALLGWAPGIWLAMVLCLIQLVGTPVRVLVWYCLLARTLSLAPWNRRQPLTWAMLHRTFFSQQTAVPPCGAIFGRLSLERVPQ